MTLEERAAHHGLSLAEYEAKLRQTWDAYLGQSGRLLVSMPEAAGMPAPGSELDVHGDWKRGEAS